MADTERRKSRWFYLNGHLHKVLHTSRPQDLLTAFDFVTGERVIYPLSETRRKMQNAYTIGEVAKMMCRSRVRMRHYLDDGTIKKPQKSYPLDPNANPGRGRWYFSEDDVLDIHEFFLGVHIGRPRQDGRITNRPMPTREELRTMLRSGRLLYVKEGDEFVPVWRLGEW